MPARAALTGVVLCGGRSVRMGRDKSLLEIGGRTLLERAITVLDGISDEVVLACGPGERYSDLGRALVVDAFQDGGPLAGLEAGLRRASTEWIAALACDMPRVEPSIFVELLERAERDGLDVCFLRTERGVEPLCAVYRKTCLAPMRAALENGERKVVSFLRFRPTPRAGELELAASLAINLNTPAEFQAEIGT